VNDQNLVHPAPNAPRSHQPYRNYCFDIDAELAQTDLCPLREQATAYQHDLIAVACTRNLETRIGAQSGTRDELDLKKGPGV